ncbi:MAG: DUF2341 domain-containing protein [Archaeoglobi archaeon]|nr:DUF2341 domain-containing protein [Archaeoglobi archaeon]
MLRDSRGVSPVIGFILLLQILIIFLAFVQTTLIPDQLKRIEADNVKVIKSEFDKFSAEISSGENAYLVVKTPQYPDYLFLLTPEPAGFSIRLEPFTINVSMNLTLPNGTEVRVERAFESARLYLTVENYFYPDTTFVLENTALFQESNGRVAAVGDQKMVKNGLNLVLIRGEMSSAYNSPHEFAFHVVSSGGRYYAKNITVSFDSYYPDYWRGLGYNVTGNRVSIEIPSGFFSATVLSPVEGGRERAQAMIKLNPFDSYTLSPGDTVDFEVQLIDRYLNPVAGERVNVTVSGGVGTATPDLTETDTAGVARTTFRATTPGTGSVTFTYANLSQSYEVTVKSTGSAAGGILQVSWLNSSGTWDVGTSGFLRLLAVKVTDTSGQPIPSVPVSFAVSNTSVVELNTTSAYTNADGIAYTLAFAKSNGSVSIYAFAGDAGDVLSYSVVNVTKFWLAGWSYRVPITIQENSGTGLTDYQALITLDSSFNWSATSSDGSDVRFTDEFGNALSYWIEEWNYGTSAKIWVKVPSIPASGTTTIYLYYGNLAANSESNGTSTFVFFDDFDDGDVSDWYSKNAWITGLAFSGRNVLYLYPTGSTSFQHFAVPLNCNIGLQDYIVGAYIYDRNPAGSVLLHYVDDGNWWGMELYTGGNRDIFRPYIGGVDKGWVYTHWPCSISARTWYKIEVEAHPDSFRLYVDGTLTWSQSVASAYQLTGYSKVGFVEHLGYGPLYADYIYVRKYASSEPTVIIGPEERY